MAEQDELMLRASEGELRRALRALYLEVPDHIARDLSAIVWSHVDALQAARRSTPAPAPIDAPWHEYGGDPDTLPQEWFLAIVESTDEYGVQCDSAPVLITMEPHVGTLFFGDGTRCTFTDGAIKRWATFVPAPVPIEKIADALRTEMCDRSWLRYPDDAERTFAEVLRRYFTDEKKEG